MMPRGERSDEPEALEFTPALWAAMRPAERAQMVQLLEDIRGKALEAVAVAMERGDSLTALALQRPLRDLAAVLEQERATRPAR